MFKYKIILVKDNTIKLMTNWYFLFIPKVYYDDVDSSRHTYEYCDTVGNRLYYRYTKTEDRIK